MPSDAARSASEGDVPKQASEGRRPGDADPHRDAPKVGAVDTRKVFDPERRLHEAAKAVPRMDRVAGTLTNEEAGAIANEAANDTNPQLLGGTINLNQPVGDKLIRIPRGDRTQNEAQPLRNYDAARQAGDLLRGQVPNVEVPQALWIGREAQKGEKGERAEIWERFDGEPVDAVWEQGPPPAEARAAIGDTIIAFATQEPSTLYAQYPLEPRTCGESHKAMLDHFAENVEPHHWETFGPAFEAIGARREAVGVRSGQYEHPAPDLPTRLTHNDPTPRNFLASGRDNPRFALVDMDLATLGDPAFDVARVRQKWERLTRDQADEVNQRVKDGLHTKDPRLADRFDERVDLNYRFLHYQRMLLLASRISDTVRAAPRDREGRQRVLAEAAADADHNLPSVADVLGTRVIPGDQFVDLVLQSERTAPSRNRQPPTPYQARVTSSSA
ncbi:MAG TPA: aminoglycoside phosphotransferase family protein [Actinomycetes bacterium]|nr:aminoglycoside phosphotransferase family protein [Actinomycetes bacterium]